MKAEVCFECLSNAIYQYFKQFKGASIAEDKLRPNTNLYTTITVQNTIAETILLLNNNTPYSI